MSQQFLPNSLRGPNLTSRLRTRRLAANSAPFMLTVTGLNRTFSISAVAPGGTGQLSVHASLFPRNTYPATNAYFRWFATAQLTISSSGGGGGGGTAAGPDP
jgi:hypothetical protein